MCLPVFGKSKNQSGLFIECGLVHFQCTTEIMLESNKDEFMGSYLKLSSTY
jgi:hypothetical protein